MGKLIIFRSIQTIKKSYSKNQHIFVCEKIFRTATDAPITKGNKEKHVGICRTIYNARIFRDITYSEMYVMRKTERDVTDRGMRVVLSFCLFEYFSPEKYFGHLGLTAEVAINRNSLGNRYGNDSLKGSSRVYIRCENIFKKSKFEGQL